MDKDTIRTILCYIRKHTFLVILSLVLAAVTVVSTLYLPILTGHAIDCMIAKRKSGFCCASSHSGEDDRYACYYGIFAVAYECVQQSHYVSGYA